MDKIGGHNLPDFNTVWYWHKDKHTDRWNIEVVPHKYRLIGFQQISQSNLTGKGKSLQQMVLKQPDINVEKKLNFLMHIIHKN